MDAVTVCSDFGVQENKVCHCFHFFPFYFPWSNGIRCHDLCFFSMLSFKPAFSLSSFTLIKRLFSSFSLSAIRVVSCAYLKLLIFLPAILIPVCDSSSPVFHMMYSVCKLNKQCDDIQPWRTPSQFGTSLLFHVQYCCFLTCIQIFQEVDQVVWYSHLLKNFPQFIVIHTVKGFGVVNEAEVDVFLKFPCFFYDPGDVGNLISGSSAFSESSLCLWKFLVCVLLKPSLKDFEHYLASMWNEALYSSLNILWHCPSLELEWKLTFSSLLAMP